MAEASREHGRLVDQVRLMEGSHSWRLTAPLRAVRRAIQRRQPPFRMLRQAALGAYRALPLSVAARLKIKGALFRALPFLFRRTSAYQAWDAYRRTTERLQVPASPSATGQRRRRAARLVLLRRRERLRADCRIGDRGHADQGDRVLPAAVPSDSRERSVVGQGVHRVDQRVARQAAVRRPLPAASARRARVLRPPRS